MTATASPAATGCRACHAAAVRPLVDFGPHPICSHFLASADAVDVEYPLALVQCDSCGTVQLRQSPPIEELLRVPAWLKYTEPERHLDALVDGLLALPLSDGSAAIGIGVHDDPLLARLASHGFVTSRLDGRSDLAIDTPVPGPAALQHHLTAARARAAAARYGRAALVVARYTYEHAYEPVSHLEALRELATPDGLVLLEVPDCTDAMRARDYTTVWEEHVLYHTPDSLTAALAATGWELAWLRSFPNTLHNALVAVVRRAASGPTDVPALTQVRTLAASFAASFPTVRARVQRWFAQGRAAGRRIAVLGAGHLTVTYLTIMRVAEHVTCVLDDNPQKQGLLLPGVRVPVRPSSAIADDGIGAILLAVSPDNEDKVLTRLEPFVRSGGRVASMFPTSRYALPAHED